MRVPSCRKEQPESFDNGDNRDNGDNGDVRQATWGESFFHLLFWPWKMDRSRWTPLKLHLSPLYQYCSNNLLDLVFFYKYPLICFFFFVLRETHLCISLLCCCLLNPKMTFSSHWLILFTINNMENSHKTWQVYFRKPPVFAMRAFIWLAAIATWWTAFKLITTCQKRSFAMKVNCSMCFIVAE